MPEEREGGNMLAAGAEGRDGGVENLDNIGSEEVRERAWKLT
jgi:hypothetical protein